MLNTRCKIFGNILGRDIKTDKLDKFRKVKGQTIDKKKNTNISLKPPPMQIAELMKTWSMVIALGQYYQPWVDLPWNWYKHLGTKIDITTPKTTVRSNQVLLPKRLAMLYMNLKLKFHISFISRNKGISRGTCCSIFCRCNQVSRNLEKDFF